LSQLIRCSLTDMVHTACKYGAYCMQIWCILTDCLKLLLELLKVLALGSTEKVVGVVRLKNEIGRRGCADGEHSCGSLWPLGLAYPIHHFHLLPCSQISHIYNYIHISFQVICSIPLLYRPEDQLDEDATQRVLEVQYCIYICFLNYIIKTSFG
jgi:hypothetical protein